MHSGVGACEKIWLSRCHPQNYRPDLGGGGQSHGLPPSPPAPSEGRLPPPLATRAGKRPRNGARPSQAQQRRSGTAPRRQPRPQGAVRARRLPSGRRRHRESARGGGLPARGRRLHALPGRCSLPAPLGSGPRLEARRAPGRAARLPQPRSSAGGGAGWARPGRRERHPDPR